MATQKVRPDPNTIERQHDDRQPHVAGRKPAVIVLMGVLVLVAAAFGISLVSDDTDTDSDVGSKPAAAGASTSEVPPLPYGSLEPGRYAFATSFGAGLDAPHPITIDVPEGYAGFQGLAALKVGTTQTGVSTTAIGGVYADACRWEGTLLGGSAVSSTDEVVAALADQEGFRVSTPTEVTVDGFPGTYMERTVTPKDLADCDGVTFRVYVDPAGEERYLFPGQLDLLWIVDLDGVPVVIDASLDKGSSAQDRAELVQMVESLQIDPR